MWILKLLQRWRKRLNYFLFLYYITSNPIENKQRKPNLWLDHVKSVREQNPDIIYKDALKLAKETYKPVEKPKKEKVRKRKSQSRKLDEDYKVN